MATGSTYTFERAEKVSAERTCMPCEQHMEITVSIGNIRIRMSREEAARLAADLLNAAGVAPVDAEVTA